MTSYLNLGFRYSPTLDYQLDLARKLYSILTAWATLLAKHRKVYIDLVFVSIDLTDA